MKGMVSSEFTLGTAGITTTLRSPVNEFQEIASLEIGLG